MHTSLAAFLPLLMLSPAVDGWLGIYLDGEREEAVVDEVIPGGPAAKAGLQVGDVLLAVGDQKTPTREAFIAAIRAAKAGDQARIALRRGDAELVVVVRLGERPDQVPAPTPQPEAKPAQPPSARTIPAPAVESAPTSRGYLGLGISVTDNGVLIDRVLANGPAAAAGVRVGDYLVTLGDALVRDLGDVDEVLQRNPPGTKLALGLRSGDGKRSVMVMLGDRAPSREPAVAVAPVQPVPAMPPSRSEVDLEAELQALRAELAQLRQQLEALRRESRGKAKDKE